MRRRNKGFVKALKVLDDCKLVNPGDECSIEKINGGKYRISATFGPKHEINKHKKQRPDIIGIGSKGKGKKRKGTDKQRNGTDR